jgi:hypothetical protein
LRYEEYAGHHRRHQRQEKGSIEGLSPQTDSNLTVVNQSAQTGVDILEVNHVESEHEKTIK